MGGWPAGYLQSVEELNSGPPKTGREQDLNPWRPDYKSSAQPAPNHAASLKKDKLPKENFRVKRSKNLNKTPNWKATNRG